MGILDVKIEIAQGSEWRNRNQRIERMRSAACASSQPNGPSSSSQIQTSNGSRQHPTSTSPEGQQGDSNSKYMDAELYRAATKRDVDGFISALERVSTNEGLSCSGIFRLVSPVGNTLLHIAAGHGNEEIVRLIAYHSPPLMLQQNAKGDTALHLAARTGHMSVVSTLLRFRKDWVHPLATEEWIEELRAIPEDEKLLRVRNGKGNTALHEGLLNGHKWVIFSLIQEDPDLCYYLNCEGKSPLYLAAEAGKQQHLSTMLQSVEVGKRHEMLKGKSPLQAAIMRRDKGLMDTILSIEPRFINLLDEEGRTPLHCAASINYVEGVRYLLSKDVASAMERDNTGLFPIHLAATKGHLQVIQELLQHYPDPREMLNLNGQNVLHTAAKNGRYKVVEYILQTPTLECLINEEDYEGNTPLHLATINWHPKIISIMTWDQRVNLTVVNNEGLTALDAAEYYMEKLPAFRKRLTWTALKAASAPRATRLEVPNSYREDTTQSEPSNANCYNDRVNTLLLVATLVATVTFAAGFTMPGGFNNSQPDQGMATMLWDKKFAAFVFCNTVAMYSAILVAVSLIWAQLGDLNLVFTALRIALPLLGVALAMMSLAFMAGVCLVVSKLHWLVYAAFTMGLVFLIAVLVMFFPLCFPVTSGSRFCRWLSYYPFRLLILLAIRSDDKDVL